MFNPPSSQSNLDIFGDYRKTSNTRRTLIGTEILDHSDAVGVATTTYLFST